MAGETRTPRERPHPSLQPGGRTPAPGDLAIVQAFVNSHYDLEVNHGAELLDSPDALGRWLRRHGLLRRGVAPDESDLVRMIELREALRELAGANCDGGPPESALAVLGRLAAGAPVELRFDADGPHFALAADGAVAGSTGLLLAVTARAMIDGSWARLKVCPGEDCGWAFYDHSRNQTGRWCSMSVCGGRAKARSHYRRRRAVA
jgi:predicted RNA-binding Zn ribbon-like protein